MTATQTGLPPMPRHAPLVHQTLNQKPATGRFGRGKPATPPTFSELVERVNTNQNRAHRSELHDGDISNALGWLLLAGAAVRTNSGGWDITYTARPYTFPTPPTTEF